MIVYFDARILATNSSGIAYFSLELLQQFPENIEIILIVPKKTRLLCDRVEKLKYKIIELYPRHDSMFSRIYYSFLILPRFIKNLNDLFISPYYDFLIPRCRKGKIIVTIHDLCYKLLPKNYSLKRRLFYNYLLKRAIKFTDSIVTVSHSSKKDLLRLYKKNPKIYVVYNNIGSISHKLKKPSFFKQIFNKNIILYSGGFEERKNLSILYKALHELQKRGFDFIFIPTGNKFLESTVQEKLSEILPNDKYYLPGRLSTSELYFLYTKAYCVVLPSLLEGFGRPLLEAFYFNTKVVASDIPVFKEVGLNYPLYFNPLDYSDFADKIESIQSYTPPNQDLFLNLEKNNELSFFKEDILS